MGDATRFRLALLTVAVATTLGLATSVRAAVFIEHVGMSDPLSQGFGEWPFNGTFSTAALPNDNGEQAWQIENTGSSPAAQAIYIQLGGTGPYLGGSGLTQDQIDEIVANGFLMSMRARVVSGPVYDEGGSQQVSAVISVAGFSSFRFDIGLGRDGLGNTVVVIPENIVLNGNFFGHDPFGSTILVLGNDYHLYQLSYDPVTATAKLLIDGDVRAIGYPGSTVSGGVVANNFGLGFGSVNLATANFALARLESQPHVPALGFLALLALGAGLVVAGGWAFSRRGVASA